MIHFKRDTLTDSIRVVECSLAKLLWENTGRPIATQAELDRAIRKLWDEVSAIVQAPPLETWKLTRLDLAYQFAGLHSERVIDALSAFRFPHVHNPPMHVAGQTVSWRGTRSRFMVVAYAKCRKMRVSGDVLRIEVRLRGCELRHLRGGDWRCFRDMWTAYRAILLHLPDVPCAPAKAGWPEAVGQIVPAEFHERILAALALSTKMTRTNRQRLRVAAAQLPAAISWAVILTEGGPPPPVVIEARNRKGANR